MAATSARLDEPTPSKCLTAVDKKQAFAYSLADFLEIQLKFATRLDGHLTDRLNVKNMFHIQQSVIMASVMTK